MGSFRFSRRVLHWNIGFFQRWRSLLRAPYYFHLYPISLSSPDFLRLLFSCETAEISDSVQSARRAALAAADSFAMAMEQGLRADSIDDGDTDVTEHVGPY